MEANECKNAAADRIRLERKASLQERAEARSVSFDVPEAIKPSVRREPHSGKEITGLRRQLEIRDDAQAKVQRSQEREREREREKRRLPTLASEISKDPLRVSRSSAELSLEAIVSIEAYKFSLLKAAPITAHLTGRSLRPRDTPARPAVERRKPSHSVKGDTS